ncbi:MAG: hypothetical protein LAP21_12245 [Acidobacteriia bacterium]|nr:hypothetical protein [Terriglobia bacterium]
MRRITALALIVMLTLSISTPAFADFQYSETSKITGGMMVGSMKVLGAFSKDARKVTQPKNTTISVKGNKMRREEDDGKAEIWDLDGRRIIHLDAKSQTYYSVTFDEMRAQMEEARKKAAEQQNKHKGKDGDAQVKMTPKIKITPGAGTKKLLGHTAKEVKVRIDMEMESTDPKTRGQSGAMWTSSDEWLAPVTGYDEMKHFNMRLAKEFEWLPGEVFGGNAQMAPAMAELRKNSVKLEGMPLLMNTSVGFSGTGQPGQSPQAEQSGNPLSKGIGGLFGKKKKKDDDAQQPAEAGSTTGSLMDMTVEVTAVSTSKLDAGLFGIPAGYKQVEPKRK